MRYGMRVRQGNNVHHSVPVVVLANSDAEARQKALAAVYVPNPVASVESVEEACRCEREVGK